jgi:hypothetical protein
MAERGRTGSTMLKLLLTLALLVGTETTSRPPAPAEHCLDARAVQGVTPLSPSEWLLVGRGQYHRLWLQEPCPFDRADVSLLAVAGWVCGGENEYVRSGDRQCRVAGLLRIDGREARELARGWPRARQAIEGFDLDAPPDRCFRPSRARSFTQNNGHLLVDTSPNGSAGYTRYRVEFSGACMEAGTLNTVRWISGTGRDAICGNPGDLAMFSSDHRDVVLSSGNFLPAPAMEARGCQVARVEAVKRKP